MPAVAPANHLVNYRKVRRRPCGEADVVPEVVDAVFGARVHLEAVGFVPNGGMCAMNSMRLPHLGQLMGRGSSDMTGLDGSTRLRVPVWDG